MEGGGEQTVPPSNPQPRSEPPSLPPTLLRVLCGAEPRVRGREAAPGAGQGRAEPRRPHGRPRPVAAMAAVFTALRVLLGLFFLLAGAVKLTDRLSADVHRHMVRGSRGLGASEA